MPADTDTSYFNNMLQVTSIDPIISASSSASDIPAAITTSILESSSPNAELFSSTPIQTKSSSLNDLLVQDATEAISSPSVTPSKGSLMVTKGSNYALGSVASSSASVSVEYTDLEYVTEQYNSFHSLLSQSSAVKLSSTSHSVQASNAASQPVHHIGSSGNLKMNLLVFGLLGSTILAFGL
ncbi:unnamed protein product [Ambrosiozyma monospora]|uniref:Unnamed protein product n=1 Tax=Ambrosiozyma monospora TaxID=43982 RepID=A0A9W6T423_AMBMO|nr:unnamed protein product [Ambrosiozyma monospora]